MNEERERLLDRLAEDIHRNLDNISKTKVRNTIGGFDSRPKPFTITEVAKRLEMLGAKSSWRHGTRSVVEMQLGRKMYENLFHSKYALVLDREVSYSIRAIHLINPAFKDVLEEHARTLEENIGENNVRVMRRLREVAPMTIPELGRFVETIRKGELATNLAIMINDMREAKGMKPLPLDRLRYKLSELESQGLVSHKRVMARTKDGRNAKQTLFHLPGIAPQNLAKRGITRMR
ncbi:MAG: hypothetical protein JW834_02970 [Candidatus Diapherotrites archaeon]|nr:hypothetical protein [Candidatus Diapherotrites archaeon]